MYLFCACCTEQHEIPAGRLLIPMHDGGSDYEQYDLCLLCTEKMSNEHKDSMVGFPITKAALYITPTTAESQVWVKYWPQEAARLALERYQRDNEPIRK